ncbi:YlmC/YmxH family sporulation protein [Alkalibacillus salilacus]|uniref:YlmC/YmxH family sporulation protein n=1 Tax=Alkalibacillus salilacus TaxID=284582 RepID=A0ABT9VDZ5_9BACI|nr:YlmC/YmxH family sporulation protein [Alkalibacillus salilacus]MDQ0159173.1 YlmC/YmxH family sporulation protein [Alkalibacillus salilacus]
MLLSELQTKDIIDVESGERLGVITDLEIDVTIGLIQSIIISTKGKWLGLFGEQEELWIDWAQIQMIGHDVILISRSKYS